MYIPLLDKYWMPDWSNPLYFQKDLSTVSLVSSVLQSVKPLLILSCLDLENFLLMVLWPSFVPFLIVQFSPFFPLDFQTKFLFCDILHAHFFRIFVNACSPMEARKQRCLCSIQFVFSIGTVVPYSLVHLYWWFFCWFNLVCALQNPTKKILG